MTPVVYLAGPSVFRPDAGEYGQWLKARCTDAGLAGLYPLDCAIPANITDPAEQGAWVYHANLALIDRCDLVLADLNFFRGAEPDSGTSFEVGYAVARGKPVYAHISEAGNYAQRIARHFPELVHQQGLDCNGMIIEAFDLPLNLMLAVPVTLICGDVTDALEVIAREQGTLSRSPSL